MIILLILLNLCFKFTWAMDERTCVRQSEFEYCKKDKTSNNLLWNLYTGHNLYFRILMPGNCLSLGFTYAWTLKLLSSGKVVKKFPNFTGKAVLTIKKGILGLNEYNLGVTVKGAKLHKTLNCWFKINSAGPVPIITAGRIRNAIAGDTVALDGTATEEAGVQMLEYRWKCSSNVSYSFCKNFYSTKKETYINMNGKPGDTFNITLTISAKGVLESTYQIIYITKESFPVIHISCEKNCLGRGHIESDPAMYVFLKVSCTRNCDKISYLWSISDKIDEFDTRYGFSDPRLIIDEYILKYNIVYKIWVQATVDGTSQISKAFWELKTSNEPMKDCIVSPNEGVSIKTLFQLKCTGAAHKRPLSYSVDQLYRRPGSKPAVSGIFLTQNMVPHLSVLLAPEANISEAVVNIYDDKHVTADVLKEIIVKPLFSNMDTKKQVEQISKIYNGQSGLIPSIKSLVRHGYADRAIQLINCVLVELKYIKTEVVKQGFYKIMKYKIIYDLLMFPPDSAIKGSITMVSKLINRTEPKQVHFAVMLSKLCGKLSKNILNFMINTKYPMLEANILNIYTTHLIRCSEFILDGNFVKYTGFEMTTEMPMELHQVVEEDYPNYKDVIDSKLKNQYIDITIEGINILRDCTSAFSMGLAYGEGIYRIGTTTKIVMELNTAANLGRTFVSKPAVKITLPKSLGFKPNAKIRMLFISFDKRIFFWDENGQNISTRVVDLSFYDEKNKLISRIPQFMDAYLDVINTTAEKSIDGSIVIAEDTEWSERDIVVYRVDVPKNSRLLVEIYDIQPENIQVVLTSGRRPELNDFINATIVKDKGRLTFSSVGHDTWYYMGVLPANKTTRTNKPQNRTITYKYSFRTQTCLEWQEGDWLSRNCKLGEATTTELIHCKCRSLSIVAGMMYVPKTKVDDVIEMKYKLEMIYTYLIFITVAIILFCYFVAMCFFLFRTVTHRKDIYFLSDNVKKDRYAYLIIVKTGSNNNAGTSSNIIIKLYGDKSKSTAHVLNYPDPNRQLLQKRSEDWFILTTSVHLGELVRLKLWFDSIGNRPTWYCDCIRICDLQLKKWWFFDVRKWFTVAEENKHYYETDVVEEILRQIKKEKRIFFKHFQLYFGPEHTWNLLSSSDDSQFTYIERISVIVSHILSAYCWALLICVTPEIRIRDGFDKHVLTSSMYSFMCVVVVSILSFGTNIGFVFCFRNSERNLELTTKRRALLPGYTINLIWSILISFIILEILYLGTFGYWASTFAWQVWFTVTTIALFVSIFVWENIYLSVYTGLDKQLTKNVGETITYNSNDIINETETQRKSLYEVTGGYGLRPYLTHLYKPLDDRAIKRKKKTMLQKTILSENIREMFLFTGYLLCLFLLVYHDFDNLSIFHNNHIRDMIEAENAEMPLGDIASLEDVYEYVNNTFIPVIYAANWYGNWTVLDPGLMTDFCTKVLGIIVIRQKRVRKNSCELNEAGKILNITHCNPALTETTADTSSYGGMFSMWTYRYPVQAGLTLTYGEVKDYTGGGYVTVLGRHISNAYFMVDLLKKQKWLDESTRVVFLEFWTYNTNRNLFGTVKVVIERSATQFMHSSVEVFTGRLMHVDIQSEMIPIVVSSLFFLFVAFQTFSYVSNLIKQKLKFFLKFWNIIDTILLVLNYNLIILSFYQMQMVDDLLDLLEHTKKTDYINYYPAIYYNKVMILMCAVLTCIATLGLWKYLRFGLMFRVFERTLITQIASLSGVFVYNFVTLVTYSFIGYLLFKKFSRNFRDIVETFTSMILLSLNLSGDSFDFKILEDYAGHGGLFFYVSFTLAMLLIVNTYITVIIMHYEDSVEYFVDTGLDYSLLDYIKDEARYFTRCFVRYMHSFRLKGGDDHHSKITPKFHRYTEPLVIYEETLNKMGLIAMGIAHNFLFRQDKYSLNDLDIRMMIRIVQSTVNPSQNRQKHIFFKSEGEDEMKLIPDRRLLEMEKALKKLFQEEPFEKKEKPYVTDKTTLRKLEDIQTFLDTVNCVVGNINVVNVKRK